MPGVSMKTICASRSFTIPRMRFRVVCGLSEMMAIFSPRSAFRSVDLPTFGLPTIEMKPDLNFCPLVMPARIPENTGSRNRKAGKRDERRWEERDNQRAAQ
jgi:hypothetical protein